MNDSKHVNASLQGDDEKKIGDDDVEKERNQEAEDQVDPWAGLAYTIEDETGKTRTSPHWNVIGMRFARGN